MARKRLQYQALSNVILPIAAAATTPTALAFSDFGPPKFSTTFPAHQQQSVLFEIPLVAPAQVPPWFVFTKFEPPRFSTTVPAHQQPSNFFKALPPPTVIPVFTSFSQPQFSRLTPVYEQPSPIFETFVPPSYDAGTPIFSTFVHVLTPPLPVAVSFQNFVHLTPPDYPPIQEKQDGIFVKKKRKPTARELDPYAEEAEIKRLRRKAIEDAVYGPPVEYTLPPLAFPVDNKPAPPNLGELPQIVLAAQQKATIEAKLKKIRDEEDDLENILKDIL